MAPRQGRAPLPAGKLYLAGACKCRWYQDHSLNYGRGSFFGFHHGCRKRMKPSIRSWLGKTWTLDYKLETHTVANIPSGKGKKFVFAIFKNRWRSWKGRNGVQVRTWHAEGVPFDLIVKQSTGTSGVVQINLNHCKAATEYLILIMSWK